MDPKFIEAYENGIVLQFVDRVSRRGFPRIVVHSADYPEK